MFKVSIGHSMYLIIKVVQLEQLENQSNLLELLSEGYSGAAVGSLSSKDLEIHYWDCWRVS